MSNFYLGIMNDEVEIKMLTKVLQKIKWKNTFRFILILEKKKKKRKRKEIVIEIAFT